MRIAIGQISPVWMDRSGTLAKVVAAIDEAAGKGADLIAFGEALVPGYPFWLDRVDGARFENDELKAMHGAFMEQCVDVERDLGEVRAAAKRGGIAVVLGVNERARDRGGFSIYCSLVKIDANGEVLTVHRKLMPTYEERLVWGVGDGHGLRSHVIGGVEVTALNCWENWMPTTRAAMYAAGTEVHVAIWPGSDRLTKDITRFVAMEGRCFVVSAGSVLRGSDVPEGTMLRDTLVAPEGDESVFIANGGSAVAGPDGAWVLEPVVEREGVFVVDVDVSKVREARQSFDAAGHYSRPDVVRMEVDRRRQGTTFIA